MMPSTERELKEQIKTAEHKTTEQWFLALSRAVGVINRAEFLSTEQKEQLIKEIYK
jgi:hypothetical protein